ncbi:hypothetical protein DFQ26_001313 [Actinomortierella ambigua]|nr:hypothetical protein DFQ26_001313 [Actinomortierella ambigua]
MALYSRVASRALARSLPLHSSKAIPAIATASKKAFSTSMASMDAHKKKERVRVHFPGAVDSHFSQVLEIREKMEPIDTFRVMDTDGTVLDPSLEPKVTEEFATKIYKDMLTLSIMDLILYEAQRQGRISFYMTNAGEEAYIGSAAALELEDEIFGQYREAGTLLYRGFTLDQFMNQCYSNDLDYGKGRQMPVHYGSKAHHFQTISSPLATQLPQASGAAYALKRSGKKNCVMCYFGEGAASEGDFHAALNIAATTSAPVIFFCRNNGFAISTPANEQYKGDGIASRGVGYGMHTIRVDGNDVWAVYKATQEARKIAVEKHKPVLIEAMTYRVGHHSTSDDSSAYRSKKEVEDWKRHDNPVVRMRKWLEAKGWWDESKENVHKTEMRKAVLKSFAAAEKRKKPAVSELFNDVYDKLTPQLLEQKKEIEELIKKYPDHYDTSNYKAE